MAKHVRIVRIVRFIRTAWMFVATAGLISACGHPSKKEDAPAASAKASTPASTKAQAKPAASPDAGVVKCTKGKEERILEIKDKDGGCETIYTKMGEPKSIATSAKGTTYCAKVSGKIEKRLTDSGYTCQ